MEVVHAIHRLAERDPSTSVLFLTPCHATPYTTHTHAPPVLLRFLDCSPHGWEGAVEAQNAAQLGWLRLPGPADCPGLAAANGSAAAPGQQQQLSQRQCFDMDPQAYLARVLGDNAGALPSLVVGFGDTMGVVTRTLAAHGYRCTKAWCNCMFQTDPDTPCRIELWSRREKFQRLPAEKPIMRM